MDNNSRDELLRGSAVDPTALDTLEQSNFEFVLPLWLVFFVAGLVFLFVFKLIQKKKEESDPDAEGGQGKDGE